MDFVNKDIQNYCEKHTTEEPSLLKALNRETNANVLMPRMLSGHFQGRLLSMFSKMVSPRNILEIGTYTGYSCLCLAEGLEAGGAIHTIEKNEELEEIINKYFSSSEMSGKIQLHIGNALEIIPTLDVMFDLVFIDADKESYSDYLDIVSEKVNPGGYIIADNVLWSGKVICTEGAKIDKDTQSIIEFNLKVQRDTRFENILLPIRDGLMILRKI